ncbi:MAG: hypothetical protein H7Z21_08925 [Hymenobacter sp.]|nr:hypothetical protein [Hymenobacter sp.]
MATHFEGLSHDYLQYFLKLSGFAPHQLWQQARHQITLCPDGYLIFDDTVLNKPHSQRNHTTLAALTWLRLKQLAYLGWSSKNGQ